MIKVNQEFKKIQKQQQPNEREQNSVFRYIMHNCGDQRMSKIPESKSTRGLENNKNTKSIKSIENENDDDDNDDDDPLCGRYVRSED